MGPRSIERGKRNRHRDRDGEQRSFNGAAFNRTRKEEFFDMTYEPLRRASMGPRSIERGKSRVFRRWKQPVLQWGRVQSNAERSKLLSMSQFTGRLQWGRVQSNAESKLNKCLRSSNRQLQWGRVQSNAERKLGAFKLLFDVVASMGPRSIERGKHAVNVSSKSMAIVLQWGRVQSNAESGVDADRAIMQRFASMGPRSIERGKSTVLP